MRTSLRDAVAMSAAVLAPFLMGLALLPLRTSLSHTNLALVVVVVAVSALGNRFAGALAALSAVAWFDFFPTEPYRSFHLQDRADVETAVLLRTWTDRACRTGRPGSWAVAHGSCQGVFVMTPVPGVAPASPEARLVAVDPAGLAALALSGQKELAQP
ncbi:DUF4118 domain-containing protein [Streptomyces tanashiensis]|uniref:DUF4118 domain-containing protein n=1 Tax=Streptomyces tanashiensis TaxID=67367 RepID=A0ABY6R6A7_9ACTN|nr:DUF4118 domain-containing protein [Streptomyces tanashiensis]UZX25603.1 DUF4118 domain-containing protein [Streptomyces tanashiensis]GGY11379.1 hypothetical protein GCM10010299_14370 [Streptomyces tanashiensis]